MPKFIPYDPSQSKMVVVNYADQLQPGTFEHTIHFLIEQKHDLSSFHPSFNNDETGRPAYDPAILLKIILSSYSKGITSSREIQWSCETNIIFKALSCDTVPHFSTIANFVSGYSEEIEMLFEQVLLVCDEQGLLGKELFALDGCKMSSNAAKEWSDTHKELTQKRDKIQRQIQHHITKHIAFDKNESRDDERRARSEQAIETLTKAHDKIDKFLKSESPRMGKGQIKKEVKSNITDNQSAKMTTSKDTIQGYNGIATVDKKHQIIVDAQAFGEGQEHHTLQPVLNGRIQLSETGFSTALLCTDRNMLLIREANKNEAVILSNLAIRSKAYWGYTNEFMNIYKKELIVSKYMIENHKYFIAENKKTIMGFYAIKDLINSKIELDALFVEPKHIGTGIGRKLFEHAINQAILIGGNTLIFQGDPNAKNFYKAMGAVPTGKQESTCIPGRFLPTFSVSLVNKKNA